jgi:hypothetical protein
VPARPPGDFRKEGAVHVDPAASSPVPGLLKVLFITFALLLLAAIGYAGWIVARYWDQVGV